MKREPANDRESPGQAARAPGKLLLAGEYAVLEGAPALVIAINRYAHARCGGTSRRAGEPSRLHLAIAEVLGLDIRTRDRELLQQLEIDTSDLFEGTRKLGLGSSAAACVAAIAAIIGDCTNKERICALAIDAHRRFQSGLGSGFDVAASTCGGALVHVQGQAPTGIKLPEGLYWQAFAWPRAASSPHAIRRWRTVHNRQALIETASRLPDSARAGADSLLACIEEFQCRLMEIDRAHRLGIVTPEQQLLAEQARGVGVEYGAPILFKQAGAGGGDISIALSTSRDALQALWDITVQSSLRLPPTPLELAMDMQGVVHE